MSQEKKEGEEKKQVEEEKVLSNEAALMTEAVPEEVIQENQKEQLLQPKNSLEEEKKKEEKENESGSPLITDEEERQRVFGKKKSMLMKKVWELSRLCGIQAFLILADGQDVFSFATEKFKPWMQSQSGLQTIESCLKTPPIPPVHPPLLPYCSLPLMAQDGESNWACQLCSKVFPISSGLKQHITEDHNVNTSILVVPPEKKKGNKEEEEGGKGEGKNSLSEKAIPSKKKKLSKSEPKRKKVERKESFIPDPRIPDADSYEAYQNWTCLLNNVQSNCDKYYVTQVLTKEGKYFLWNRWGRVGEPGISRVCYFLDPRKKKIYFPLYNSLFLFCRWKALGKIETRQFKVFFANSKPRQAMIGRIEQTLFHTHKKFFSPLFSPSFPLLFPFFSPSFPLLFPFFSPLSFKFTIRKTHLFFFVIVPTHG